MEPPPHITLATIDAELGAAERNELAGLLASCVEAGASIGFLLPVDAAEVDAYWRKVGADLAGGGRLLLVAREGGRIVGSVQLAFESRANGRHRAEVQKLMVRPTHRRRGLAGRLMADVESRARARGITLLFLDTSDGPGGARAFYAAIGYAYAGGIPGYALDPDGTPAQNAIYYKTLAPGE